MPIISKATGINLVAAATRIALGEKLRDLAWGVGLRPKPDYVVVKVPVFSFAKMRGVETILGPEMKSTGEVLGIDATYAGALRKGFVGAGIRMPQQGGRVLVSVSDEEKPDAVELMRRIVALGHTLVATPGTYELLQANGIAAERVNKIGDPAPDVLDLIRKRAVDLVINDFRAGRGPTDNYRIRRAAVEASIASLTSLDTAHALGHRARVRGRPAPLAARVPGHPPRRAGALSEPAGLPRVTQLASAGPRADLRASDGRV